MKESTRKGRPNRSTLMAHADLERLGANPIEMLVDVYRESMAAYKAMRGYSEKSDSGAAYLSVAGKAAVDLARFKHPTLSAIALKDMSEGSSRAPLTTSQAIDIIKQDPFAPPEIKDIETDKIVDAMNSTINAPFLPTGQR